MKFILILLILPLNLYAFGFKFNILNNRVPIKTYGASRYYADGTYAISCNKYKNPLNVAYNYSGAIGNGIYKIKPDSNPAFDVYCDMTTDGGGWTLNFKGDSNFAFNTQTSQYINQTIAANASEVMTYFASSVYANVSTKYKFTKPAGFDIFTEANSTTNVSVTNLSNSHVANYNLMSGHRNFADDTCDPWITASPYGIFGLCVSGGSNPASFYDFPFYSGYAVPNTDFCVSSNQIYSVTTCSSSKYLTLWFR